MGTNCSHRTARRLGSCRSTFSLRSARTLGTNCARRTARTLGTSCSHRTALTAGALRTGRPRWTGRPLRTDRTSLVVCAGPSHAIPLGRLFRTALQIGQRVIVTIEDLLGNFSQVVESSRHSHARQLASRHITIVGDHGVNFDFGPHAVLLTRPSVTVELGNLTGLAAQVGQGVVVAVGQARGHPVERVEMPRGRDGCEVGRNRVAVLGYDGLHLGRGQPQICRAGPGRAVPLGDLARFAVDCSQGVVVAVPKALGHVDEVFESPRECDGCEARGDRIAVVGDEGVDLRFDERPVWRTTPMRPVVTRDLGVCAGQRREGVIISIEQIDGHIGEVAELSRAGHLRELSHNVGRVVRLDAAPIATVRLRDRALSAAQSSERVVVAVCQLGRYTLHLIETDSARRQRPHPASVRVDHELAVH